MFLVFLFFVESHQTGVPVHTLLLVNISVFCLCIFFELVILSNGCQKAVLKVGISKKLQTDVSIKILSVQFKESGKLLHTFVLTDVEIRFKRSVSIV